jgi:two-component sensor histidine kinase
MTDNDPSRAELEADNRRLRGLLDQRNAPSELRHRLNSTLAVLRVIIRKTAETERDLPAYVAHLEDRLDAIARAQAAADAYGFIDLHTVIADELFKYGASEGDRVSLSGPTVHFLPRAGQVLALAVHELAVNSVEHGILGTAAGKVDVRWSANEEQQELLLAIVWQERGSLNPSEVPREGFGTEVLTRTLAYELRATSQVELLPGEFRCTISFPLSARIGHVETPTAIDEE